MKYLDIVVTVTALTLTTSAMATDLPSKKTPAAAASTKKTFSWDGTYFGGSIGRATAQGVGNANNCNSILNLTVDGKLFPGGDFCTANGDTTLGGAFSPYTGIYINNTDVYRSSPRSYAQSIYWAANGANINDEAVHWSNTNDVAVPDGSLETGSYDHNEAVGGAFGAQLGTNKQVGTIVYGAEIDLKKFSNLSAESWEGFNNYWDGTTTYLRNYGGNFQVDTKSNLNWMTTLRGRLGLAMGNEGRLLPYVTGGAALAIVSAKTATQNDTTGVDGGSNATLGAVSGEKSFFQTGWVLGGGVEYALTDTVSIAAEYQATKLYGEKEHTVHYSGQYVGNGFDIVHKVGFDRVDTASVKLNYHF